MIFVTVGTHEQQFNRLVAYMDKLKKDKVTDEEIVIQTGYSTYDPKHCTWQKFYPYQQMLRFVDEARIVITHGGPSSFIMPLQIGKTPIVVPRQKEYGEHVNDHQVTFTQEAAKRMGTIITVTDIETLADTIAHYDELTGSMHGEIRDNNKQFNAEFERIAEDLMARRKKKTCRKTDF